MKLFLLSLLAIGSAQAHAIDNPYRSDYWDYNPARGQFPVQSTVLQGYLRYFDNNGIEHLVTYKYPEPVYGVRQLNYLSDGQGSSSPGLRSFGQDDSIEFNKAREAHFRAWALQQYQALKCEIDALRAEGKEPSADMYMKFRPLEKIALTAQYSEISDIPEIKRINEDHLRIWNEVRNKNLQTKAGQSTYQQSVVNNFQGELKTYNGQTSSAAVAVDGTPEQKQTYDEHLRIHSEQIANLKKLELEHQQKLQQKPAEQQPQQAEALAEFERAKQEHLRIWNEAKLSAEQASSKIHGVTEAEHNENAGAAKQQISALKYDQSIFHQQHINQESAAIQKAHDEHLRLVNEATQRIHAAEEHNKHTEQGNLNVIAHTNLNQQVLDTPEVLQARSEHLRLVDEANLRAQNAEQQELKHKQQSIQHIGEQSKYLPETGTKVYETAQNQPIFQLRQNIDQQEHRDHTDFQKAHDDHIRLVNEAALKIKSAEDHIKQLEAQQLSATKSQTQSYNSIEQTKLISTTPIEQQPQQVVDTPEVIRAREEHLRLFNEAKLRAESVEQKELKYKQENEQESHQIPLLKTQFQHQPIHQQQQQQLGSYNYEQPQAIQDTPEVIKAREDHLRLVSEANLNSKIQDQNVHSRKEQQANLKHQSIHIEQQQGADQQLPIQDTPEVIKARQEHLRLFSEAKGDQNAQYNSQQQTNFKSHTHQEHYQQHGYQQSSGSQHYIEETPEVKHAREEHLRIFNNVKSLNEQEGAKIVELKSSGLISQPLTNDEELENIKEEARLKEETRLVELQGLREAERLQEEYKQLELERIREAERLAEEQQQIKAELKLLKIEEEKRFQMEKFLEEGRLKKEQEELQKLQQLNTEEYKQIDNQNTAPFVQPELAIIQYTQPLTKTIQQIQVPQQQQQHQHEHEHKYANNPFLRANPIQSHLQQSFHQQQQQQQQQQAQQFAYSNNPFLKASSFKTPIVYYPIATIPNNGPVQPTNFPVIPVARYVQSSQHLSTGSKAQQAKDDFIKTKFPNTASTQPADTAVALLALQRATNDHFRAHELALEQLRLARLQDPDCN